MQLQLFIVTSYNSSSRVHSDLFDDHKRVSTRTGNGILKAKARVLQWLENVPSNAALCEPGRDLEGQKFQHMKP
jgi:hypothetical protein